MSLETAKEYLRSFGMEGRVLEFSQSSATVAEAARAAGTEPGRIAKTMSFYVGEEPVLILLAGDVKVDNHKYKEQFHTKASHGRGMPLWHKARRHRLSGRVPEAL